MKEKIKKNIVYLIPFTLGIVLSITIAKATTYISGSNIGYNGTLSSDNIQDAIDELYTITHTKKKIEAWEYHETGTKKCINGEEDTCISTTCYKTGSTCDMGTVIKYYVNDSEYRYFYVLRDNGTKITMQQRENTIRNIAWISKEDYVKAGGTEADYGTDGASDKGPITILNALENATSTWTNVNMLEYTPGTTPLHGNQYTGCLHYGGSSDATWKIHCDENVHNLLESRKTRARLVTALEASDTGCLVWKNPSTYPNVMPNAIDASNNGTCPNFMYNYMYHSTLYGGDYDDNFQDENGRNITGYWTMSATINYQNTVWDILYSGRLGNDGINQYTRGARAVVEITKSNL